MSANACYFCRQQMDPDLGEWSLVVDYSLHEACLRKALRERTGYDKTLHRLAVEFGMQGSAPSRKAIECREGHPYSPTNTYVDRRGNQQCRICKSRHARAQYAKNAKRYKEARDRCGKHVAVVVGVQLRGEVLAAAQAAKQPVSAWVRAQLVQRLPEWEARYG